MYTIKAFQLRFKRRLDTFKNNLVHFRRVDVHLGRVHNDKYKGVKVHNCRTNEKTALFVCLRSLFATLQNITSDSFM